VRTTLQPVLALPVALALGAVLLAGCGSATSEGGGRPTVDPGGPDRPAASCADVLRYSGADYLGHGSPDRDPQLSGVTGEGTRPGCDDGGGAVGDDTVQVHELAGISPEDAVESDNRIYLAQGSGLHALAMEDMPEAVQLLFAPVDCDLDGSFTVAGDWLEAPGAQDSPGDEAGPDPLLPPYQVVLRVDSTSPAAAAYDRTLVNVRVEQQTDPPLTHHDVATALWTGGRISATAHCDQEHHFVADSLTATPPG
jgi:hypothetical protein